MKFTPEIYRAAAVEHASAACSLYSLGRYVLSHYVAGLAVECIFRAYKCRIDPVFDEHHNLNQLAKGAHFYDVVQGRTREVQAALDVVVALWVNYHRFRSEKALRAFLKERKLDRGIRGDFVKENSRRIVDAAQAVVLLGVTQ